MAFNTTNLIPHLINLDFKESNFISIPVEQYDKDSAYIEATLYDGGSPYIIPAGSTASFGGTKPSSHIILETAVIENNKVYYKISEQCTVKEGDYPVKFTLYLPNNAVKYTQEFKIKVRKAVISSDAIADVDEVNVLNELIVNATEAIEDVNDATTNAINATNNANNVAAQLSNETLKIYKGVVVSYSDLATTYPNPENGWTVTVSSESASYRYNGTKWINLGVISSVGTATDTTLGVVKGGGNINVAIDGTINVNELGDLSTLGTTNKSTLVKAINEVNSQLADVTNQFQNIAEGEIQAVLNDEIVHTEIENKLRAKETEYAPRLTTAEENINALLPKIDLATIDTQSGTSIQSTVADDAIAELTQINGATTVTPANLDLDISPSNIATITSAKNFDVVACGKNLINGIIEEGNISPTTGENTIGETAYLRCVDYISLNGKPSILSFDNIILNSGRTLRIFKYDKHKQLIGYVDAQGITLPIVDGTYYIRYRYHKDFAPINFQLELGSTATPYELYKSNQITIPYELRSLPNGVKDMIEYIGNGKAKHIQKVKQVVFDGSADEGWILYSGNSSVVFNSTVAFRIALPDAASLWNKQGVICTHFKAAEVSSNPYNNDVEVFAIDNNQSAIVRISKNRMNESTVTAFKQWLSENPITVQYELAEPIETIIDLPTLKSYAGITNIYTTSEIQPTITVKFMSRLKNTTEILLAEISKLKQAIISLGGTV